MASLDDLPRLCAGGMHTEDTIRCASSSMSVRPTQIWVAESNGSPRAPVDQESGSLSGCGGAGGVVAMPYPLPWKVHRLPHEERKRLQPGKTVATYLQTYDGCCTVRNVHTYTYVPMGTEADEPCVILVQ